jgi:hypothetical protein
MLATVVLVRGSAELARWPIGADRRAELALVDELARLHLAARRLGYGIVVREVRADLAGLLDLVGLSAVLRGGEVVGQAELGEQVGVEEEVQFGDPVA